ncbi:MAG TPA: hypothetical protein VFU35_12820 [Jatrophihabitans sp.]|nr:hypothetical protein [Jatrophihabitans sp.]
MLVIGVGTAQPSSNEFSWSGRRHDDDAPGASRGNSSAELFDAVFHALHDGEQVAVGVAGALSAPLPDGGIDAVNERALEVLATAEGQAPDIVRIRTLLDELGKWRPWTVVSTSLGRWRATTSVLVWQIETDAAAVDERAADAAVEAFYERVRTASDAAPASDRRVLNLPAAIAMRAGLGVDTAQLTEPPLAIAPLRERDLR